MSYPSLSQVDLWLIREMSSRKFRNELQKKLSEVLPQQTTVTMIEYLCIMKIFNLGLTEIEDMYSYPLDIADN